MCETMQRTINGEIGCRQCGVHGGENADNGNLTRRAHDAIQNLTTHFKGQIFGKFSQDFCFFLFCF